MLLKWLFRIKVVLVVGTLLVIVISLHFRLKHEGESANFQNVRMIESEREMVNSPRSIIAVVNTPRMGGVSISRSFVDSWKCINGEGFPSYLTFNCLHERMVVQAHDADAGSVAVQQHRREHPDGQCLIVTAIRSPATWFPSFYLSQSSHNCEPPLISTDSILEDYRRFLGDTNVFERSLRSCLPRLLAEFDGGSLQDQAKIMDHSGGYSILGPASSDSAFAGCKILLLRMEQSDRWPVFIKRLVPDSKYFKRESHSSLCPELSEHIKIIQDYELTVEEKMAMYTKSGMYKRGGEFVLDWFDAYGYAEGDSIKKKFYSTSETVIAVINIPKTGSLGITQSFLHSWTCKHISKEELHSVYICPNNRLVIQSRQFYVLADSIRQYRQEHPHGRCLIMSSIRHPSTWLPSLYIAKRRLCKYISFTKYEMLQDYRQFIVSEPLLQPSDMSVLPMLLEDFNGGSLKEQSIMMDKNGGYSILPHSSPEGAFVGCELLLLRMEQIHEWSATIEMMLPDSKFSYLWRGASQASQCSALTDHIEMLQNYELTPEERQHIYDHNGGLMEDWFDAYNDVNKTGNGIDNKQN